VLFVPDAATRPLLLWQISRPAPFLLLQP